MKHLIKNILLLLLVSSAAKSQILTSASIRRVTLTGNDIEVLAKPSQAVNAQVGNINFAISIPDQGVNNPTEASIVKTTTIANVLITPDPGNPFIIGARAYYSYVILQNNGATDIPTSFAAGVDNVVTKLTFPSNTYFTDLQLNDLTSTGGGPNLQMTWYIQFNQGVSDVTDYNNPFYGIGAVNNGGAADQFVTLQASVVVPVKFLGVSVSKKGSDAVVKWSVENESSITAKYEILRSSNGRDFATVATILPKNNGLSANTYELTESNIVALARAASGIVYYRIRQIDKDGVVTLSEIKSIRLDGKFVSISTYPNPVRDVTKMTIDLEKASDVLISVSNSSGQQVTNIQFQGFKGANFKDIDMSKFAGGNYLIKVQTATEVKTLPVTKVN